MLGLRLPPEDENELRYRNGMGTGHIGLADKETKERLKQIIKIKNPYTQATKR